MCIMSFGYPATARRAALSAAERRAIAETRAIRPAPAMPSRGSVPVAGAVTGRFSHTASNPPVSETRRRDEYDNSAIALAFTASALSPSFSRSEPSAPSCSPSYDSSSSYDSGSSYSACDSGGSFDSGSSF